MNEKELINKIKQLKEIKPEKSWVIFCREQISKQKDQIPFVSLFHPVKFALQLFNRVKPAYVISTVVILLIVSITGFFFLKDRPIENQILVELEPTSAKKEIVVALEDLQVEMDRTIKVLKEMKKPQEILKARNIILPTLETTKNLVFKMEEIEVKKEVMVLTTKMNELENTLNERTAVVVKDLIKFLETRMLTEVQQEILEQARKDYEQGNYHQALINAMLVKQIIKE
jgi:hypothetical protein